MNPWAIGAGVFALGAFIFGGDLKLPAFLQRQPPTAQLKATSADLAKAQQQLAEAQAELARNKAAQDQATKVQLDYTQQMGAGALLAIQSVPGAFQSPEVKLAEQFALREQAGFESARGRLSPEAQAEIKKLFDNAMAAKDAQVATLTAALADKDTSLKVVTAEKTQLALQVPTLQASIVTAQSETKVIGAKKDLLEQQVVEYADTKAADDREKGSLAAYGTRLLHIFIGVVLLAGVFYYLAHFALPNLAQQYPGGRIDTAYQYVTNWTSSHQVAPAKPRI